MLKHGLAALVLLGSAFITAPVLADTLDINPGHAVLGLTTSATEADFRKKLGEPDSVIAMSSDRHGLLYGQNVMLVFKKGRLWEARTWLMKGWSTELFHEWVQYLPKRKTGFSDFTVDGGKYRVGQRREEVEKKIRGMDGDGDEYSIIVSKSHAEVWFGFEYDDAPGAERDVKQQKVSSLVVRFQDQKKK